MGFVWRFSPYKGARLLVHLAIADTVNDQGENEFYMGQSKLAAKARVSRQAANDALATLETDGYIERVGELEGRRGIVVWRFVFVRGDVVWDSRRRVASRDTSSGGRRVTPDDTNRSPQTTRRRRDVSPQTTENPRDLTQGEPTLPSSSEAPDEARALVVAHWERCNAEQRPTPVVRRGRAGSPFMAVVGIVRTLLDAGWPADDVAAALWDTEGGHTLQGLGVQLTKSRARTERADSFSPVVDVPARPLWTDRPDCPDCDGVGMLFDEATSVARRCACNPDVEPVAAAR